MSHLSILYSKHYESEQIKMKNDVFYSILLFQHILQNNSLLNYFKFIENGDYIIRGFDRNGFIFENMNLDGEIRSYHILRQESSNLLLNPILYSQFKDQFNKTFRNKCFYYVNLTNEGTLWLNESDIVDFISNIEKENNEALMFPGNSKNKEYLLLKFESFFKKFDICDKETHKIKFLKLKETYLEKKFFLRNNIFKIINVFSNTVFKDSKTKCDLYRNILQNTRG